VIDACAQVEEGWCIRKVPTRRTQWWADRYQRVVRTVATSPHSGSASSIPGLPDRKPTARKSKPWS